MVTRTHKMTVVLTTWAMLIAAGGCARSFTAREYPAFYDPNLRTVAVVSFENETHIPGPASWPLRT